MTPDRRRAGRVDLSDTSPPKEPVAQPYQTEEDNSVDIIEAAEGVRTSSLLEESCSGRSPPLKFPLFFKHFLRAAQDVLSTHPLKA